LSAAIIIPARYGSSRLPGKPMMPISGISMLERVWKIAKSVRGCTRVVIATEDQRIIDHAKAFGAEAVLTPEDCQNGTERTFATITAANVEEDFLINFQGDAVLTPPWVLEAMVAEYEAGADFDLVTPATRFSRESLEAFKEHKKIPGNEASGTTVVFDGKRNALYFSKSVIPHVRGKEFRDHPPVYRHIGLYGYTKSGLSKYMNLAPSHLEQVEGLEQLRAIENHLVVRVAIVDYQGRTHQSVDSQDDMRLVEEIIAREGELLDFTK
jgi:3-deoxy-manno-octulosonate cytidylyltransferase (CMP-KDO synthetase)